MSQVRTRFAPSPTGFIHLGNIRSALYPWAFARANNGVFILRIEDTDEERSSQAAVDVILEGMQWLGLNHDEGPYYQMQRMERYKEVVQQMLDKGLIYPCYMSSAELDAVRERQMTTKENPRYDGTWRPEPGKTLPPVPAGVKPVLRFKNPQGGSVVWEDKVKGRIEISNDELDDLVIARPAPEGSDGIVGTPTYNFCVVVDDMDMGITHVIRGDDHVNNTPRQINILRALGQEPPVYAHLPTVMTETVDEHGEKHVSKMSKRHGAKAVTQYRDEGYLADAGLASMCALFKDRCAATVELADWLTMYVAEVTPPEQELAEKLTDAVKPAVAGLAARLATCAWEPAAIAQAMKDTLTEFGLKMPQLAIPVRLLVCGRSQTPSVDAVLSLFERDAVLQRLR